MSPIGKIFFRYGFASALFFLPLSADGAIEHIPDFLGHWGVGAQFEDIDIQLGGTAAQPTLLRYRDCYGTPCKGSKWDAPEEYFWLGDSIPYGTWTHVESPSCRIVFIMTGTDVDDQVPQGEVSFGMSRLYANGNELEIGSEYCEKNFAPSVCKTKNLTAFVFDQLQHPSLGTADFWCHNSESKTYPFVPSELTYPSLNGTWSAPSGILKNPRGETLAKGVRFTFLNQANRFSLEYQICQSASECVTGKDLFGKIQGRAIGQNLLARCQKPDGSFQEANLGEEKGNVLSLLLPDRDGQCQSAASPRISVARKSKDGVLEIEVKEASEGTSLEGNATLFKEPAEK